MKTKLSTKAVAIGSVLATASIIPFSVMASHSGEHTDKAFTLAMNDTSLDFVNCPEFFAQGCRLAVLNGDLSEPNSDVVIRTPGNYEIPQHWHTSAKRMKLVSGEMELNYEGQDTLSIESGMYVYAPEKLAYSGKCISSKPCELFVSFDDPVETYQGSVN